MATLPRLLISTFGELEANYEKSYKLNLVMGTYNGSRTRWSGCELSLHSAYELDSTASRREAHRMGRKVWGRDLVLFLSHSWAEYSPTGGTYHGQRTIAVLFGTLERGEYSWQVGHPTPLFGVLTPDQENARSIPSSLSEAFGQVGRAYEGSDVLSTTLWGMELQETVGQMLAWAPGDEVHHA